MRPFSAPRKSEMLHDREKKEGPVFSCVPPLFSWNVALDFLIHTNIVFISKMVCGDLEIHPFK